MTQFEGYLIRLKMELRKLGDDNAWNVANMIHEKYVLLKREPDMTDEELAILQKQFKEFAYERLANRSGSKS